MVRGGRRLKTIMTTFGKNEQFIPYCVNALDHFWPEMSNLIIFSDQGNFSHGRKIISTESSWARMVLDCLNNSIRNDLLKLDEFVIILLEDHIPHTRVPHDVIELMSEKLSDIDGVYVNLAGHGPGEPVLGIDGALLHHMEFEWPSSLHPAIWSVRHFLDTLKFAIAQDQLSPWQFERLRLPGSVHYTTGYCVWPSPFGGFLVGGKVNRHALATMKSGPNRFLCRKLLIRLMRELPGRLWRQASRRLSPRYRRRLA